MCQEVGKPFHESIVDAIAGAVTHGDFNMLARLIIATKIPENHQMIIESWRAACASVGQKRFDVIASLLLKKEQAEIEMNKNRFQVGGDIVILD